MAVLCVLALFLTLDHTRGDSATIDEPPHIYAGMEYLTRGVLRTNPEHPPLSKLLAALSLVRAPGLTLPDVSGAPRLRPADLYPFFLANAIPLPEMLALARAPFRWLLAALIVGVYLAARAASGTPAALLASAMMALDPNLIAHAGVVHSDVAAALLMTLTVVLTLSAVGGPSWRWMLAGLTLGLAIATKFTALILVPLVVLAPLLLLLERESRPKWIESIVSALAACMVAALVVYAVYAASMRAMAPNEAASVSSTFLRHRGADPETVARYARLTQRAPEVGMFLSGVKGVQLLSAGERDWNFLNGRLSRKGFPQYFFVAFLLKSTPAMLLLTAAIAAGGRHLRNKWGIGMLVVVATLFVVSIPSAFNIGVRHILPIYPLLAIVGASALAARLPRRAFAVAAAALLVSAAVSLASIHPFELGYFNVFGGPRNLNDSNVDWGQDVDRMHSFLRQKGWERDTRVVVFAMPRLHGVERYPPLDLSISPGHYATSSYMEYVGPTTLRSRQGAAAGDVLQRLMDALHTRGRRVARVGSSITIWDLPAAPPTSR
ncbi:MAG: glycosyltransferase family 39 protein [Acidobacteriota bacterium]